MKRVKNIFETIVKFDNLLLAFRKAFKGCRKNRETLAFFFHQERELLKLQAELLTHRYRPKGFRQFKINDPKERTISVAPFRDRVVHHAVVNVLEPIWEKAFIYDSYATRKGKGTHRAVLRAQGFMKGAGWYLKADIKKFFDSVDHEVLMDIIARKVGDRDALRLVDLIVERGGRQGKGLPIGNLTSQFFANVYLDPLDHFLKDGLGFKCYVRYMDDMLFFSGEKSALQEINRIVTTYLADRLHLALKPVISGRCSHGVSFLGMRVFPSMVRIRRERLKRSLRRYRKRRRELEQTAGQAAERAVMALTSIVGHMGFWNTSLLRKALFAENIVKTGARAQAAPTAWNGAVPGTTTRGTCAPPIGTGTGRATGTTISGSALSAQGVGRTSVFTETVAVHSLSRVCVPALPGVEGGSQRALSVPAASKTCNANAV